MSRTLGADIHEFSRLSPLVEGSRCALTVADQVQELTIPAAIRPGFTLRDAVLNSSAWREEKAVYLFCSHVTHNIRIAKTPPIPITCNLVDQLFLDHTICGNNMPEKLTMPYPAPGGKTCRLEPLAIMSSLFNSFKGSK
jgi:hypothetical protein